MIPQITEDLTQDITYEKQPSYTYKMNTSSEKVAGDCKGLTAMQQAVYKILNTERYKAYIYSWNYGIELSSLFGKPVTYCVPEIERRIKEALLQDNRITKVYDFIFDFPKRRVIHVKFKVDTSEGMVAVDKEVNI